MLLTLCADQAKSNQEFSCCQATDEFAFAPRDTVHFCPRRGVGCPNSSKCMQRCDVKARHRLE